MNDPLHRLPAADGSALPDRDDAPMAAPIAGLEALRTEHEPTHDLWPAIEARLARAPVSASAAIRPRRRQRWVPMAAAASAMLALAGLIAARYLAPGMDPFAQAKPVDIALRSDAQARPEPLAVATLARRAPLPPPSANRALLKANLKIVKSAEDQLRHALATDPNDQYLQNLLASTQDQKTHLRDLLDRNRI